MSQDFGIEDQGSGFDFDDDEQDLEAMFNKANQGAETGDDDDSHLAYIFGDQQNSQPQVGNNVSYNEEPQSQKEEEGNAWEAVPEPSAAGEKVSETIPTYDETVSLPETNDYTEFDEYKTPEEETAQIEEPIVYQTETVPAERQSIHNYQPEQTRVAETPNSHRSDYRTTYSAVSASAPIAVSPSPAPVENYSSRKFNITTEEEDIKAVRKTIRILDAYRALNSKAIVAQLIYNENDVDPNDEAALVVKVLRSDPMLGRMMTALRESASEKDRVERVFYILNTEHDVLKYLGGFLETVADVTFENTHDHISFAKEIEKTINDLDSKIVQYVADAQSVLAAAEEEKE